jgi:hypothetical protein
MRFFYACLPSCIFNGAAVAGEPSGSLAYFCGQSSKPVICRSPRLEAGLRCNPQKEAYMPNRPRTSVPLADQVSNSNKKALNSKTTASQEVHAMGLHSVAGFDRSLGNCLAYANALYSMRCLVAHEFRELPADEQKDFVLGHTIALRIKTVRPPKRPCIAKVEKWNTA